MKTQTLVLFTLILFLSACRKDRSCTCTVTREGTVSVRSQTPSKTITISPLPPIEVGPATDTTVVSSLDTTYTHRRTYKKVLLRTVKYNCISYEEPLADSSVQSIPGTATITTIETGKEYYSCEIE